MPVAFIGGSYDDLLFVRQANALLDGHWLGAFDQTTLSKGCLYPLFLAFTAKFGIPVIVATQSVYLAGALLLSRVAARLVHSRAAGSLCLALLALSPVLLDGSSGMLMREPLYAGLTVLALATVARNFLLPSTVFWSIAAGLASASFWLTREEGVWLLPSLAMLVLYGALTQRRMASLAWFTGACLAPLLLVAGINQAEYGVFRTNDFQTGPFPTAYGALSRIEHDRWQRLIPVPADARARAYAESPAARSLQPFLEGNAGRQWAQVGCQNNPIPACNDIQAGWFMWSLRDATTQAGHYHTAREADRFYQTLAHEIDAACDTRRIPCLPRRRGYLPPLRHIDRGRVAQDALLLVRDFATLGHARPGNLPTLVQEPLTTLYRRVTPNTPFTPAFSFDTYPGWKIAGRLETADPATRLAITPAPAGLVSDQPHVDHQAFTGAFHCAPAACTLTLLHNNQDQAHWLLATLAPGTLLSETNLRLTLDTITPLPIAPALAPTAQFKAATLLGRLWASLTPFAFPIALLWCAWRCLESLRRRSPSPLTILAVATSTAIASRIAFLAVLDATAIPVQFRYEMPGLALVPALVGLMVAGWVGREGRPGLCPGPTKGRRPLETDSSSRSGSRAGVQGPRPWPSFLRARPTA